MHLITGSTGADKLLPLDEITPHPEVRMGSGRGQQGRAARMAWGRTTAGRSPSLRRGFLPGSAVGMWGRQDSSMPLLHDPNGIISRLSLIIGSQQQELELCSSLCVIFCTEMLDNDRALKYELSF